LKNKSEIRNPKSQIEIMQLRTQMEILIDEMLDGRIMLNEALSEFEKLYIQKALARNSEHLSQTALALGIHRNTLSKRVATYQTVSRTPKRLIPRRSK
jgi:transcriptional regulator with PAS, ATPase and Fis domain